MVQHYDTSGKELAGDGALSMMIGMRLGSPLESLGHEAFITMLADSFVILYQPMVPLEPSLPTILVAPLLRVMPSHAKGS
eukprot:scaffold108175_cov19-Tisochrysis_lutea.AAC.1